MPFQFFLLENFLVFLDSWSKANNLVNKNQSSVDDLPVLVLALAKFKMEFLSTTGLGIHAPKEILSLGKKIGFSNSRGGFESKASSTRDFVSVSPEVFNLFIKLNGVPLAELGKLGASDIPKKDANTLQKLLSSFLEYTMERPLKSEKYLNF